MRLTDYTKVMVACVAAVVLLTTSCEKKEAHSTAVELLSFGPAGVSHGEQIRFIGNNLDKVTAIDLVGVSIAGSDFMEHTSELIVITVPREAEQGPVILKTPAGDITSKSPLNLEVPVIVTEVTDAARPGDRITLQGEYLNWVSSVIFANDLPVTEFVSQSLTELVVEVPQTAQSGPLTILTGGTEPLQIELEEPLTVALPVISSVSPNPVERGAHLTITGENLDLAQHAMFRGLDEPVTEFVSQSETELVITVPEGANKGPITLVAPSGIAVESVEPLELVGDLPPLDPLNYPIYVDAMVNNWSDWGWGGSVDFNNTENVRDGNTAIKKVYDGTYGGLRFGGGSVATDSYTEVVFSIFGTPGTGGLTLNVVANEQWGAPYTVTIVEGEWVEFKLSPADLSAGTELKDLLFQDTGWSGTIFVDHVGLR